MLTHGSCPLPQEPATERAAQRRDPVGRGHEKHFLDLRLDGRATPARSLEAGAVHATASAPKYTSTTRALACASFGGPRKLQFLQRGGAEPAGGGARIDWQADHRKCFLGVGPRGLLRHPAIASEEGRERDILHKAQIVKRPRNLERARDALVADTV